MVLKTQGPPAGSAGYAGEESGGQCGGAQDTLSPKFLSLCMNHGMRGADVSLVSAEAQATSVRKPSKDHTWVTPGPGILQKEEGGAGARGRIVQKNRALCCAGERGGETLGGQSGSVAGFGVQPACTLSHWLSSLLNDPGRDVVLHRSMAEVR